MSQNTSSSEQVHLWVHELQEAMPSRSPSSACFSIQLSKNLPSWHNISKYCVIVAMFTWLQEVIGWVKKLFIDFMLFFQSVILEVWRAKSSWISFRDMLSSFKPVIFHYYVWSFDHSALRPVSNWNKWHDEWIVFVLQAGNQTHSNELKYKTHVGNVSLTSPVVYRPLLKSVCSISLCQPCSLFVLPPFPSHSHSCAVASASAGMDCLVLISHQDLD